MKKLLLLTLLTLSFSAVSAQQSGDSIPSSNQNNSYYQPAQRVSKTSSSSSAGICKDLVGTIVTLKGSAPYKSQPDNYDYWPRFSVLGSAGYIYKFLVAEGVVEYMQANTRFPTEPSSYYNFLLGSARVGVIVPIALTDKVLLIPNVKGQLGGAFYFGSGFSTRFVAGAIGGLDFGFRIGGSKMFSLGFVYEYRWFIDGSKNYNLGMMGGQLAFTF